LTKELHNKSALFLCKNYERIIIPEFKTQNIVKKKYTKNFYNKMKEEGKEEEMKKLLRENTKKKRMNKKSKFVLNTLSHYKFRKHLINKGYEYGCEIIIGTEENTTRTCTFCGSIKGEIEGRTKKCSDCGRKINRDNAGSRNILIKNVGKNYIK
jgi:putative transposase